MTLDVGLSATSDRTVADEHTAAALGSGDLAVLATPQVLAWCEAATVAAVAGALGPDDTTVGAEVALDHLRPTPVGATVEVRAVLTRVDGRRLTFDVEVSDRDGQVAVGEVTRVVVGRTRFMDRMTPR